MFGCLGTLFGRMGLASKKATPAILYGPVSGTNSTATVGNGVINVETSITVQAKDAFDVDVLVGGATLVGTVSGANPDTIAWTDNGDGTYTGTYTPTTDGDDYIDITLNGDSIAGTPYLSSVVDSSLIFYAPLTTDLVDDVGSVTATLTRATTAYHRVGSAIVQVASGDPRIHPAYGTFLEMNATNLLTAPRDNSNAAWTKTNITANTTSTTDPLGVASTTVELQASAANGTILQTTTSASAKHCYSVSLKRVSGTGGIDITLDGGTTWVSVTLTNDWQEFETPFQTLANPQVGIRIQTSGDVIAADLHMAVVRSSSTIDQASTFHDTTRNTELMSFDISGLASVDSAGTLLAVCRFTEMQTGSFQTGILCLRDGTANNAHQMNVDSGNGPKFRTLTGGSQVRATFLGGTGTAADLEVFGAGYGWDSTSSIGYVTKNAATLTDSTAATLPTSVTQLCIGTNQYFNGSVPSGWISHVKVYSRKLSLAEQTAQLAYLVSLVE